MVLFAFREAEGLAVAAGVYVSDRQIASFDVRRVDLVAYYRLAKDCIDLLSIAEDDPSSNARHAVLFVLFDDLYIQQVVRGDKPWIRGPSGPLLT